MVDITDCVQGDLFGRASERARGSRLRSASEATMPTAEWAKKETGERLRMDAGNKGRKEVGLVEQGRAKEWSLGCVNSRPRGQRESGGGIHAT